LETNASQSSVSIKTTAKGQKQIDVKVYQNADNSLDLAVEATRMMKRTEAECEAQGYTLVGS